MMIIIANSNKSLGISKSCVSKIDLYVPSYNDEIINLKSSIDTFILDSDKNQMF